MTSTVSPALRPSSAAPSGDVGETVPSPPTLEISSSISSPELVVDDDVRADDHRVGAAALDDDRGLEPCAQDRDAPLEQALLVLGGVVLEVLGEVAVAAGDRDRLHDLGALRPFELGELGGEPGVLLRGELLVHG